MRQIRRLEQFALSRGDTRYEISSERGGKEKTIILARNEWIIIGVTAYGNRAKITDVFGEVHLAQNRQSAGDLERIIEEIDSTLELIHPVHSWIFAPIQCEDYTKICYVRFYRAQTLLGLNDSSLEGMFFEVQTLLIGIAHIIPMWDRIPLSERKSALHIFVVPPAGCV